jgi:hypothetical protein
MANSGNPSIGTVAAEPEPIALDWAATALLIIDMQRDFMEPGGFGETLGNDVSQLARAVKPIAAVLAAAREPACWSCTPARDICPICPTRRPPRSSAARRLAHRRSRPMGRILIRGEPATTSFPSSIRSQRDR